ncbi:MAG TPA: hypothetical protein VF820_00080 [Patescibacteria group bacterium]
MIYEIKTARTVTLDPSNTSLSLSEQAQLKIMQAERKRGEKARRNVLPVGRTTVGPSYSSITYSVAVSSSQTYAEVIRFGSKVIATYRGVIFVPETEREIDRTSVEPGEYVPLAEPTTALILSLKKSISERGLRRVTRIRARYFIANVSNSQGFTQSEPSLPSAQIPKSPTLLAV